MHVKYVTIRLDNFNVAVGRLRMTKQVYYRAAGGVVICNDQVLLLDRPSRLEVRLPKGHIEEGELAQETALREVGEETGYQQLVIVADLGERRVQFVDPYKNRQVVRDDRFFLMELVKDEQLTRDEGERQFCPNWVPIEIAADQLTFESEKEFVRRALQWLEENH
jgi:8-oxo-dGTP pyrophosphatase MutT (NUDIX family)